jgi:hypothetical protein
VAMGLAVVLSLVALEVICAIHENRMIDTSRFLIIFNIILIVLWLQCD